MRAGIERVECVEAVEEAGRSVAQLFPVLCAWCEKEGRETVINWTTVPGSHGICKAHGKRMMAEAWS